MFALNDTNLGMLYAFGEDMDEFFFSFLVPIFGR